jgi:phospholipase C
LNTLQLFSTFTLQPLPMDSRREFIKKAAMLSGAAGINFFPESIQRAFAINPEKGTTYLDAEHVVILMQENRSFDHCFGALRGVRGFNDPRAITLPNKNTVWLQTNNKGETFAPFRLNIKDTNATWMGSLPHGWTDQVDARNNGNYDQWLQAKASGHKDYKDMPLTLGYYNREDLPFYYSLADAFTICDQNFCSSLTGTTPNRLYLWTGKVREDARSQARIRNEETDYGREANWKTFPERLEENNISWKVYQNEISAGVGFEGEEDSWLANFTDNPLEWFEQHRVHFSPAHMKFLPKRIEQIKTFITSSEEKIKTLAKGEELAKTKRQIERARKELAATQTYLEIYTPENFNKLSQHEKNLHTKAFTTNVNDPHYHELTTLTYKDGSAERTMKVPAGDVLHQFRSDVKNGQLPTVSWLVAPENFSDHPGAPWYGAWYLSEAMDILTQNPEVWKKTIFILCYDENDGYFDHVPPFVPPVPNDPTTGKVSNGIDTETEYVRLEDDLKRKSSEDARGSSIGLGYRVPLVIASPWSRGGAVCSQVFDHTSILQFLETFLTHKTGKKIEESNISAWRRTVCGDLTSAFKPYNGETISLPPFIKHNEFVESIHKAQFKKVPGGFHALTKTEIEQANTSPASSLLPRQETGTKPSRALPYQLYAYGRLNKERGFDLTLEARNTVFKEKSVGSPFLVYSYGDTTTIRSYAVSAGDVIKDTFDEIKTNMSHHLKAYGPNGFFREFHSPFNSLLTLIDTTCDYETDKKGNLTGNVILSIVNNSADNFDFSVIDNAYQQPSRSKKVMAGTTGRFEFNLTKSYGWYDLSVTSPSNSLFLNRFAGRVETGRESVSDPAMG